MMRVMCAMLICLDMKEKLRANDNGEPSGTAGKPILGQINSNGLTDIRYCCREILRWHQTGNKRINRRL